MFLVQVRSSLVYLDLNWVEFEFWLSSATYACTHFILSFAVLLTNKLTSIRSNLICCIYVKYLINFMFHALKNSWQITQSTYLLEPIIVYLCLFSHSLPFKVLQSVMTHFNDNNILFMNSRFEPGAVRRTLDLPNLTGSETYPVLWGLSTTKLTCNVEFDALRSEVSLSGKSLSQSKSPWQKKQKDKQSFQVHLYNRII